jgi:hypothetical protein
MPFTIMRCFDLAFELIGHSLLLGQYPDKSVETGFSMFGAVLLKVLQNCVFRKFAFPDITNLELSNCLIAH